MGSDGRALPHSLARLRFRLTAWYVGTFLVILLALGIGLFALITRRFDADLDASLRDAWRLLVVRSTAGGSRAASELAIPERRLLLFDSTGAQLAGAPADGWLVRFARRVPDSGSEISYQAADGSTLRAYGRPFVANDGRRYVAVTVGDEVEVEDKFAALIATAAVFALVATLLVGVGGWIVARQSIEPVDRAITQMRRFMADAAHELRTPITVVRNRTEIALQRPREAAEYADALRGIEREAVRVGRIVEDLLTLARADAGERAIDRQRVFLDDVTLDAAEAARALAAHKLVRVDVDEFEESPVIGDAALLRQLALILLDNAIKFSPCKATVHVSVHRQSGQPTLVITDHGDGIPAEQLPHVFERFFRGDAARTRTGPGGSEGTGLGLSIARWIVDEHGATIRLESKPGEGTRAIVNFPAPE